MATRPASAQRLNSHPSSAIAVGVRRLVGTRPARQPASWPRRFLSNRLGMVGVLVLLVLGLAALFAPALAPSDPSRVDLASAGLPPGNAHIWGTDSLGRDLFSRALYGARVSMAVGMLSAAVAVILGMTLGVTSGYRGGWLDTAICRLVDGSIAMPAFFLIVAIQGLIGQSVASVILMVSAVGWMASTRVIRASTMSLRQREFVTAAGALGCSGLRIVVRHLLPNMAGQASVLFTLGVADAMLLESALSFLGLGVPPTEASWGSMLSEAQSAILSGGWWIVAFPGVLILLTTLSVNLIGDSLQETLFSSGEESV